jgi:hypothetical protein
LEVEKSTVLSEELSPKLAGLSPQNVLGEVVLVEAVLEEAILEAAKPEEATSEEPAPGEVVQKEAIPGEAIPAEVPSTTGVPEDTVTKETDPSATAREEETFGFATVSHVLRNVTGESGASKIPAQEQEFPTRPRNYFRI